MSKPELDDLEDGLQMHCAEKTGLDYIITENAGDFLESVVPAISASDFAELMVIQDE